MEINYGIVAVPPGSDELQEWEILHFCAYEEKPTDEDFENLKQELMTDQELQLVGTVFVLMPAPDDVVLYFKNMYTEFATSGE